MVVTCNQFPKGSMQRKEERLFYNIPQGISILTSHAEIKPETLKSMHNVLIFVEVMEGLELIG